VPTPAGIRAQRGSAAVFRKHPIIDAFGSSRTRHLPNQSIDPAPVGQARYFDKTVIHHSKYDAPYRVR